jgi:agmatine deiminase
LTEAEIEDYLSQYLGAQQIIWLDGEFGGTEDITDQHIDGFVKFVGNHTLVTMNDADLAYWYVE